MNAQKAAHYKMLAAKHQDTPGDLAAAYREIGRLIDENEQQAKTIHDMHLTMRIYQSYISSIREFAGNGSRYNDKRARYEILDYTGMALRELNNWLWEFEDSQGMPPATDNPRFVSGDAS